MKKFSILLVSLLLVPIIIILSGCAPSQVTVYSSDGNVSISVPSGWNTNDTTIIPAAIIGVSDAANHEYVVVTGLPKSYFGANSTLNDYLALLKKNSVALISNAVWGNPSSITINGLNGLTVQATGIWRKTNTDSTFFVNVLENSNYNYDIVGFTSTSLLAANQATLQSIMNSFQAQATTHTGGWKPYTFPTTVILFFIFLIVGIGLVFLGKRIKSRIRVPHPGNVLKIVMVIIWVIVILGFLSVAIINRSNSSRSGTGPIFPITLACAAVTFIYLAYISRRDGILPALGNGFVGAAAGPMVFEFFFDLIVIPQIQAPATFLAAYFGTLDFAVLLTLSLLFLPRRVFVTRHSIYALGAMFIVFAIWALFGFSYPSNPASFTLNAISKVLGFITIIFLFTTEKVAYSTQNQNKE